MNKKAFTLLELVFVIVILGILAALALPRLDSDIRERAGTNLLSAIRFTQQMALIDDVTDPRYNNWQRAFWRLGFQGCSDNGYFYTISSDKNREGNIDTGEEAVDPLTGKPFNGVNTAPCENDLSSQTGSKSIYITKQFGISDPNGITFENNCGSNLTSKYIGFDHMGRPHRGFSGSSTPDYSSVLHNDCTLTFKFDDTSIADLQITIEKETGHAYIVGQPDS